jgi:mannan endo-1,4-beta-mannosidase
MKFSYSILALLVAAFIPVISQAQAIEPVNPHLIPEARAVLNYLASVYGKQSIMGISGTSNADEVQKAIGHQPAIIALDLSGWNSPTWGKTYTPVVERVIQQAEQCWKDGFIVSMQFHWKHPGKKDGTAWVGKHGKNPPSGPFDMTAATKPGTEQHTQFMEDLAKHADYLERLAEARVPILWRPFHEVDGGWFWWTDKENPESTAEMWRILFKYLVEERQLNNLIWVYSAALKPAKDGKDVEQIDYRKRFYPGAEYVDISGIDIYANDYYGWEKPQDSAYPKAYQIMTQVSPGKMLALCECGGYPNPTLMQEKGPRWLYSLPWWGPGKQQTAEWIDFCYNHDFTITKSQVPSFIKNE